MRLRWRGARRGAAGAKSRRNGARSRRFVPDEPYQLDLIRNKRIDWPRLEDADYIMVAGSGRPLIDAFRLAHVELIEWMQEFGFGKWDAYALLSQLAESSVANIVDPNYTVVMKIPKKLLPKLTGK